ncbi:MAG: AmmeMemoRadiSam system protein B, partial [Thermus sp.]
MDLVRPPAVAGYFYPLEARLLWQEVEGLLHGALALPDPRARGLLSPHAGYPYSGKVAAEGFKVLSAWRGRARRILLLGPSHFVPFLGVAFYPYR